MPSSTPAARPRPRKRFGKHFLVQLGVARRIVALAELGPTTNVLEIGPGMGVLTRLLAGVSAHLWAIEVDRDLAGLLRNEFADQPHVHIVEADALTVDFGTLLRPYVPVAVVANLPYNIATPLLLKLLAAADLFSHMVLMLQREVVARLCALPGSKAYGSLSVAVQLAAEVQTGFGVGPAAFAPRPKVDSAVVVVRPHRPPRVTAPEREQIERVVRAVFEQRRKQLGNSLQRVVPDAGKVLAAVGIDPRRRPETLSVDDFVRLTRAVAAAAG